MTEVKLKGKGNRIEIFLALNPRVNGVVVFNTNKTTTRILPDCRIGTQKERDVVLSLLEEIRLNPRKFLDEVLR